LGNIITVVGFQVLGINNKHLGLYSTLFCIGNCG